MADTGQSIADLDKKRMAAMCQQDVGALREILADDRLRKVFGKDKVKVQEPEEQKIRATSRCRPDTEAG